MEHLEGILKITDAELGAIESNGKYRSREEIDSVYKLIDIAKDIYCIWDYERADDDMSYADGPMYRGMMYDDGSYARGRGRNAKRDSMGRYSREGRSYRMRGYSRADEREDYIDSLHELMERAPDENTRQSIQRMIQQAEQGQ